ncbi:MAG: PucR family transcriptional regulator [Naasia sp.]|jgi:purine catabolism regulator|uniref:PucR family transcriptional regulator n=1 Tax=Naasia sp. TaxID=2546198 RepID=UPI0026367653|nr:PucR family transcriptional regulator [Naasia sp.]MCU1571455.1 PucR family transcriptional regulator [Naasia sp.]
MDDRASVLNVGDLVSTASLGVRVLAGTAGLGRAVLWAHSCEMPSPERWLGPHELLMTVGLCVPREPSEQVAFLRRLDDSGLAGLMIGDHETAPPVSHEMLEEADRREFPVLLAAEHIPYAVVARHVAAANSSSQILHVLTLSKLYQLAANADSDVDALAAEFASLLRVELRVSDELTGLTVLQTWTDPAVISGRSIRTFPLRGTQPALLHIAEYPDEITDGFLLVHLMKILELNIDRVLGAVDLRARASEHLLATLLAGGSAPESDSLLGGRTAGDGFYVASFAASAGELIARSGAILGLPVLVAAGQTNHHALFPRDVSDQVQRMAESCSIHFGVSSRFSDYRDTAAAAVEADRVLAASRSGERFWAVFEGTTIAVFSRSRREAEEIIETVLGPLVAADPAAGRLRQTLFSYLRNDRHWQRTADELGIHRQTLSYRLHRIEEETGLNANRSADLAAMWIAYQAWGTTRDS